VLLCGAILLLLWGVWDGVRTGAVYFRGERATGIIVRNERSDDTRVMVNGAVCPVSGDWGSVGHGVPVAFPRGRPIDCIVRRPSAFKWSLGASLLGGLVLAGATHMLREAMRKKSSLA
jgi:hypothetical protein